MQVVVPSDHFPKQRAVELASLLVNDSGPPALITLPSVSNLKLLDGRPERRAGLECSAAKAKANLVARQASVKTKSSGRFGRSPETEQHMNEKKERRIYSRYIPFF